MRVSAVIGLNYGDEGKGLVTDWLVRGNPDTSIVVRFCGGANAGHTVELKDGTRHVFSHFGSGTLREAPTYWSRYAIANPVLFVKEYKKLLEIMPQLPDFLIHPKSIVTTPLDMIANQREEKDRGDKRHSSCGVGIHKTVIRNEVIPLTVKDIFDIVKEQSKIQMYCLFYQINRFYDFMLEEDKLIQWSNRFYDDCETFIQNIEILWNEIIDIKYDNIVFEGSQGIRLSRTRNTNERYLTNANTDLMNIAELWGDKPLDVYGVSRCYLTRHGNGPLEDECSNGLPFPAIIEKTNVLNEWQGQFRYGKLTNHFLSESWDLLHEKSFKQWKFNLVITCLDHAKDKAKEKIKYLTNGINADKMYGSFGPMAEDIIEI